MPTTRKPAFCICENKDAELISAFVFATWIGQSLYFLNPKFQASSHLMWLYSPVCVGPGRKPEDRFSHNEAQWVSSCLLYVYTQGTLYRSFFRNFKIELFCFAVAISYLVHDMETMYGIC